ncbi:MAG: hypothetical protein OQK82_01760 [Candidatus Pacearchaeota archaeon]|nr:hypothetical protein [Candidatus Pacearchaeota archaeon]
MSSIHVDYNPSYIWEIDIGEGTVYWVDGSGGGYTRCVRGGQ